jgi:hypothetical protein
MGEKDLPRFFRGDEGLLKSGDGVNNVFLNYSTSQKFEAYVLGYKDAAEIILGQAQVRPHMDLLIYPCVFLYRHYLELRMKSLIKNGNQFLERNNQIPKGHNLEELWIILRKVLTDILVVLDQSDSVSESDLRIMDKLIQELTAIDKDSQAFRYHIDAKKNKTLSGITHINLRNLSEVTEKISWFFEGFAAHIEDNLDMKYEEMEALGLISPPPGPIMNRKFRRTKD